MTRVIIEIDAYGGDVETAIKHVLDSGVLQDALVDHGGVGQIVSCVSKTTNGLETRAIPGGILSDRIRSAYRLGAHGMDEDKAIKVAEGMIGGLSRDEILLIAYGNARLVGDTSTGLRLERYK